MSQNPPKELSAEYLAYIASPEWRTRRERYFRAHLRRCMACLAGLRVDLHHLRYDHFREEPDEDLAPLCRSCHESVHHAQRQSRDPLDVVTRRWIRRFEIKRGRKAVRPPKRRGAKGRKVPVPQLQSRWVPTARRRATVPEIPMSPEGKRLSLARASLPNATVNAIDDARRKRKDAGDPESGTR